MSLKKEISSKLMAGLSPKIRQYSSLEVKGLENLAGLQGGALLSCNHSGGMWWDALCLLSALEGKDSDLQGKLSFIAHHWDAKIAALRLLLKLADCYFLDENPDGIVPDSDICRALQMGKLLCIYPEESYHSYRDRYTLFRFSPQVIAYSLSANVPIVPTVVIGVEEAAPVLFGPKPYNVPLHIPLHPPVILPKPVTIEFGKPVFAEELLSSSEDKHMAAQRLRDRMVELMSGYRKVKVSDKAYITESRWL